MDFLRRVNQTKVAPSLLGEAMEMHAALPSDDRSAFEVRSIRLVEMLDRKGFGQKKLEDLAVAIDFRLTALARLLKDQEVRGWTLPANNEGVDFLHRDLIRAAAEEPLIKDISRQAVFDPESFRARVLKIAKPEGKV